MLPNSGGLSPIVREVVQPGRIRGLGPRGRRFESCPPDRQIDKIRYYGGFCRLHDSIVAIIVAILTLKLNAEGYSKKLPSMKLMILVIVLLASRASICQRVITIEDTLSKYSYLIVGRKGPVSYPCGTGFFVKTEKGLKFITASHVISGFDPFAGKHSNEPFDTIRILYPDILSGSLKYFSLDIRSSLSLIKSDYVFFKPDMLVFDIVGLNEESKIYTINDFLDNSFRLSAPNTIRRIEVNGFSIDTVHSKPQSVSDLPMRHYEVALADRFHRDPFYPNFDRINYRVQPSILQGMSGAPVFITFKDLNGLEKVVFAGVQIGSNYIFGCAYIIYPEIAIREIHKPASIQFSN